MTDKEFCKLDTAFYGEEVDHIKQIALRTFNGEELKEYVEHCIKLHLLNIPDVVDTSVCDEPDEPVQRCKCCKSFHEPDVCCYD